MTFEQACHFVIQRLQALDHIRREAERPFWLQALRREFPEILGGLLATQPPRPSDTPALTQTRPRRCPHCFFFHDQRLSCRWGVYALDWRFFIGQIDLESPEVVDRSDTFPDDTQLPLDEWNAKVDAILEETRRWQAGVEEAHG